jgi:hypothetical protein
MHFLKMKNHLAIFSLLVFGLSLSCKKDNNPAPPVSNVHLKDGLLLYLPFDGNFADSSGNGNQTTPVGGASLTYDEHGYANSAFGSSGNSERLLVTNNGSIHFDTAFSVSFQFMIRDNSSSQNQIFLSMVQVQNGYGPSFNTGLNCVDSSNFGFDISHNTGCDNFGGTYIRNPTAFIPQPESWYNSVSIYHNGKSEVYINGKLISSATATTIFPISICQGAQVVVGGWWDSDPLSIHGKMDEVRLYNRALNADEIAELSKDYQ